ncbi:hypothetical protein LINPERHAP2_LOCUS40772 [Linum perenne]
MFLYSLSFLRGEVHVVKFNLSMGEMSVATIKSRCNETNG